MELGFTGTRHGMTVSQREALAVFVEGRGFVSLHHGDCIGSDMQMHRIGRELGFYIVGHPPLNPKMRAWCECDLLLPPLDYIPRNHAIVDACAELIATPQANVEEVQSGTWATIRYARKRGKLVTIVFPDGSFGFSP